MFKLVVAALLRMDIKDLVTLKTFLENFNISSLKITHEIHLTQGSIGIRQWPINLVVEKFEHPT